ncbi:MAG: CPCC family cysteine-rich protein [Nannocystaceae bacterium]
MSDGKARDRGRRSEAARALLAAFEARRAAVRAALAASNVLHHKHTCPCCGLPTLDRRGDCETCVVCLWEDAGGEGQVRVASPPNYVSLEAARLAAAAHLRDFEADRDLDLTSPPIDPLVRTIKRFEARLARGELALDRDDFAANLAQLLSS